jgi:hypothetical protein
MTQKAGCPFYMNPSLGKAWKPSKASSSHTDFKNPLKHLPTQLQEHSGTDENAMEAPTDPDKLTF